MNRLLRTCHWCGGGIIACAVRSEGHPQHPFCSESCLRHFRSCEAARHHQQLPACTAVTLSETRYRELCEKFGGTRHGDDSL